MSIRRRRKLRILVMMQPELIPPESTEGMTERELYEWKTEIDVLGTLRGMGHEVRPIGLHDELLPLRKAVTEWKPHVVINLLEVFFGLREFDHHVVSYLELLRVPYTGCNPRGLVLARDKALSKQILAYHRIAAPKFEVVKRGRRSRRGRKLTFPLIVKGLTQEGSEGIAQASVVWDDKELDARVQFIHESLQSDVIVEEYIDGREIYVGIIGNQRLKVLPPWELFFENRDTRNLPIATSRVKHDLVYQERHGIFQGPAALDDATMQRIMSNARRVYRTLSLDGYARIDYRLRADGVPFFIEANPNPEIAKSEEFASAAAEVGLDYESLLDRIVSLGVRRGSI
ncbi:MAG: D-alanine--D-alanine ligase [Gemmatimonadaceae bacterium]